LNGIDRLGIGDFFFVFLTRFFCFLKREKLKLSVPVTVQATMPSVRVGVLNGVKLQHTLGGYLVFARDQWPESMGEACCWGELEETEEMTPLVASWVAQLWKRCRQKFRRECGEEALLQRRHPALPDPTPHQVELLVDALVREDKQEWCLDTDDEDDSDDEGAVLPLAAASPSQLDAVAAAAE